ncbi:RNA polymerase II associated protein 1 [Mortierella sp. AD032]|nr:RNA polymerase II associated protein 1 [Mortierella sp. AD032]
MDQEQQRLVEHERVNRQRRHVPETEDDLLAMQEEFARGTDRPAASVFRVRRPPTLVSSTPTSTSTSELTNTTTTTTTTRPRPTTVVDQDDEDDDDIPPPLEKDVVSLDDDELPMHPPTVQPSTTRLKGSRFLQQAANKGPRSHFPTPGERFEIDLDDDGGSSNSKGNSSATGRDDRMGMYADDDQDLVETEDETRKRLINAGASMGQILNEVKEKPVGEVVAPTVATTTLGSLIPNSRPAKGAVKGKSLFAKRLAESQGKAAAADSSSPDVTTALLTTPVQSSDIPASASYTRLMGQAKPPTVGGTSNSDNAQPLRPTVRPAIKPSVRPVSGQSHQSALPPRPALHSVLKKASDSPQSNLMDQIDEENKRKLASMSQEEIAEERAELMRNLDPELIKKLMKRGTPQRRVSFSEGVKVEDKVVNIHDVRISHGETSSFEAKRHEEEGGDHPLALKKKYYSDVPAEPEKMEWMGIDGVDSLSDGPRPTPGKSVAPGQQPYTVQEADPPAAHYRFDFGGQIMDDDDTPVHLGLHHHGMDPTKAGYTLAELLHLIRSTVPSQRILPLNIVAKVLQNCRKPDFAPFDIRAGILRWLIDLLRAPVYLRSALDDKTDSGLVAAVNAVYSWIMPPTDIAQPESIWESLTHLDRGYERTNLGFKYQAITRFANMELKPDTLQSSQEQGSESEETIAAHAILASKDPVDGLVAMNILPRFRYILDVCQLPPVTNSQILDILLTIVRTHPAGAKKVFECEGMIATLIKHYGAISWPSDKSDLELGCTAKAISILDTVIRSSKKLASAIIEEGHLEPLLRFLVLTPEPTIENKQSFTIQTHVLKLFRALAAYGLYCNVLGDSLQSVLVTDIARAISARSQAGLDPIIKSFLSRKISMFFQLATAWTHAAADVHRTIPEHSLCWAQAAAFLDPALEGITNWTQPDQVEGVFDVDYTLLISSTVRYISTWARYLSTNPPESEQVLERVWKAVQFSSWAKSNAFNIVHSRLAEIIRLVPELAEQPLPHVGITLNNPSELSQIASTMFEVSLCAEYLTSHLTAMYYLARLTSAPAFILAETIQTLVAESVFGLVEKVTKYELAIQDQIPMILPPWMAFLSRHGVYFVAHWLTAMDVLVYQQDPDNSSHIKLTFFPLFQVTALSLLQIVLPGDESLSNDVLRKILFNPQVLGKLLNQNAGQIAVVKRVLEPLYLQCFIKSESDLSQSQSLLNHDGRGIKSLVLDYGAITGQPLFNWLFYPIELLFKSKLTYVEESGTLIAATSVAHVTLDFVYSLLQTLDGVSFELVYMAALKVLALEGEKEPARSPDEDEYEYERQRGAEGGEDGEEEEEEDGFMDQEVESTINKLLDHFSTKGDCSLVRDDSQGLVPLSEKTLSLLTAPLPFSQFMKNFMENSFTTGTLLQFQPTAARLLFPAMAISSTYQLLIWQESFNFLASVTTPWEELDAGTLKTLIQDGQDNVTPEVLKHYAKAVVNGRVIKQRNPALYWIAVHHLSRAGFGHVKMPSPPRGGSRAVVKKQEEEPKELSTDEAEELEERRAIVKAIVGGTKSEELVRDWIQYDGRNFEQSSLTISTSVGSSAPPSGFSPAIPSSGSAIPASLSLSGITGYSSFGSVMSPVTPSPTSPAFVKSPSRPLSLLTTSASFPLMGSNDYMNCDNILTPPECFRERRQMLMGARKEWIKGVVGEQGVERVENAILAGAPVPVGAGTGGVRGHGHSASSSSLSGLGASSGSAHYLGGPRRN